LYLPLLGTKAHPNLLFPLESVERNELHDLIRAILAKQGVTKESDVQEIVERAEIDSEVRVKIYEARQELHRLMKLRAGGMKLIQRGFRKWAPAFYRPIVSKGEV
jgi:hypothetical protein